MKQYKNLTIIGTSHIAIESIKKVQQTLNSLDPELIALELDFERFKGLMSKQKHKFSFAEIKTLGIRGWLLNILGAWIEKSLGKRVGVKPGSEMKKAIYFSIKHQKEMALIDQDIKVTLKKLSKSLTLKEKVNFFVDIVKAIFQRNPEVSFDLKKVPDEQLIYELTKKVKKRYPSIYNILIKERDEYMAKNLYKILKRNKDKKILAIMGAGHEQKILDLIKKTKGDPKSRFVLVKPKLSTSS